MSNNVHKAWVVIEDWLEKLRIRNRPIHFAITFLAIAIPVWLFSVLAEKLIDELEWGTIMKCLLYMFVGLVLFVPAIVFLALEIKAARAKKIQLSFTGWLFGLVVVFLLLYKQLLPSAFQNPNSADQERKGSLLPVSSLNNQTEKGATIFCMNQPGESKHLNEGQTLDADFANMKMQVYSISSDRPAATINMSVPGQGGVPVSASPNSCLFTNWFKGKCYIASLSSVGYLDNPQWVTVKVEENDNGVSAPSQSDQFSPRWYLLITRIHPNFFCPNEPSSPYRILAKVNDTTKLFPNNGAWFGNTANPGDTNCDSFPTNDVFALPALNDKCNVSFEGFIGREQSVIALLSSPRVSTFRISELPKTEEYNVIVGGQGFLPLESTQSQITIYYTITNKL